VKESFVNSCFVFLVAALAWLPGFSQQGSYFDGRDWRGFYFGGGIAKDTAVLRVMPVMDTFFITSPPAIDTLHLRTYRQVIDTVIPQLRAYPEPVLNLPALEFKKANAIYSGLLMFISGAAHGYSETLTWHWPRFQAKHPNALPGYWNPRVSWVNKYKTDRHGNILQPQRPAYFGSTTFLVWTTDWYHAFNTISRTTGAAGLTIPLWTGSGKKLKHYALEVGAKGLVWSAGFHTVYTVIY
jgi:hypothetical protein